MSIVLADSLKSVGGAHTGVAPVNLLDVLDANGNLHYWSDRPSNAPVVLTGEIDPIDVKIPDDYTISGASTAWSPPVYLAGAFAYGAGGSAPDVVGLGGDTSPFELPAGTIVYGLYAVITGSIVQVNPRSPDNTGGTWVLRWPGDNISDSDDSSLFGPIWSENLISSPHTVSGAFGSESFGWEDCYNTYTIAETSVNLTCRMLLVYSAPPSSSTHGGGSTLGVAAYGSGPYIPWLVCVPQFSFHRSLQSDSGEFVIQNLSGDTLSRDFEKIMRRSTFEGAMFAYRSWQADAEAPWLYVLGTLTVDDVGGDTVKLKALPLIDEASTDTPCEIYGETCQLDYGSIRCSATGTTECSYSFQSCQVPVRFMGVLNHYEKNYGETRANTVLNVINRRRKI